MELNLDGTGVSEINTGIGFLDHMLTALSKHGRFDLKLACKGDLHVDDHHTAEDCALTLGECVVLALLWVFLIRRFVVVIPPLHLERLTRR